MLTGASGVYDAVYVPGGADSVNALLNEPDATHFVEEAFRHCKAISAVGEGVDFVRETAVCRAADDDAAGSILSEKPVKDTAQNFIKLIAEHRNREREEMRRVPA